jgi:hypothetical protein
MPDDGRLRSMSRKPAPKPKLTDADRHKRFVDMAREVGASADPKDFEKAFKKVLRGNSLNRAAKPKDHS